MLLNHNKSIFIIYLAALAAFAPFSTDIYLASMPTIQHLFNTSVANVQLTLSLFFVGYAVMQLVWGPLSDRIGRKGVVLIGVAIFIVGSLLSALSQNITFMIIARVIQATGACSGIVASIAMVRDTFPEKNEMSKVLSTMLSVTIIAPMVAPVIGSYLLYHINWQANFYFLAIYGCLLLIATLFLKETYPKALRKPLPVNKLLHAYSEQIIHLPFLLSVLAVSSNFSVIFCFISASSFIYIKIYHISAQYFGYFFAFNALALTMGGLTLKKFKNKISDTLTFIIGAMIVTIGALSMIIAIYFMPTIVWCVVVTSFIVTFGIGILYAELMSYALKNVVHYTGITSSLTGSCRFAAAAGIGALMGVLISTSAMPMAVTMLGLNILTVIFMILYAKCSHLNHSGKSTT